MVQCVSISDTYLKLHDVERMMVGAYKAWLLADAEDMFEMS